MDNFFIVAEDDKKGPSYARAETHAQAITALGRKKKELNKNLCIVDRQRQKVAEKLSTPSVKTSASSLSSHVK